MVWEPYFEKQFNKGGEKTMNLTLSKTRVQIKPKILNIYWRIAISSGDQVKQCVWGNEMESRGRAQASHHSLPLEATVYTLRYKI